MINILMPEEYSIYKKNILDVNVLYENTNDKKVDIGIYDLIENIDQEVVLIGLDISTHVIEHIKCKIQQYKDKIYIYIVKDIEQYEALHYLLDISKDKIYIKDEQASINIIINKLIDEYYLRNNLLKEFFKKDSWKEEQQAIKVEENNNKLIINSNLQQDKSEYLTYFQKNEDRFFIEKKSYQIKLNGRTKGNIECKLFVVFYENEQKIDTLSVRLNQTAFTLPEYRFDQVEFKLRIQGTGQVVIDEALYIETKDIQNSFGIEKAPEDKYLVLANAYPSTNQLYKNGFIHRRVKCYKEQGLEVDVYSLNKEQEIGQYFYDDIQVYTGNNKGLLYLLKHKKYRKILIHFPNEEMIDTIKESGLDPEIVIWIHGFGAERYTRRLFDYSEAELRKNEEALKARDTKQMNLMKQLYTSEKVTTVYVSNYILKVAEEDAECKTANPVIIPNIIDSDLFSYRPKPKHQRNRILMIRPFVAPKYGCDIAVDAIIELSKRECFKDMIITIYGEGPLFNTLLDPIKNLPNVEICETFLSQKEIAELHKKYGIMLLPTRHDTQGVSMGEAMSSGLVVATNRVWAIPEYIDDNCGILSENNDYITLANKIEELYYDPDKFLMLSHNAAKRVREQCDLENTIKKECELIRS